MPTILNEKREFQRLLHSKAEVKELKSKGFESVMSSNVSAVARDNDNLVIRFHGGATYSYIGKGKLYEDIFAAASKGKWVWRFLIRPNVPFRKGRDVVIDNDVPSRDMMEREKPKIKLDISTMFKLDTLGILDTMALSTAVKDLGTIVSLLGAINI